MSMDDRSAEYNAFSRLVDQVLSVPREEIKRREEAYKKLSSSNPKKRGPKLGSKKKSKRSSVSPALGASSPS
jgi:hypothetical protein